MKTYTRTGDKGTTALIGGERVSKCDPRVEAYGTIDEAMAHIGVLMTKPELDEYRGMMVAIQNKLMVCGSELATSANAADEKKDQNPHIAQEDVALLEKAIDRMEGELPKLRSFVLPGGKCEAVALTHVVRTVLRRAERRIVTLESAPSLVLKYVNRLSDYFFVLGRQLAYEQNDEQTPWRPDL